MLIMLAESRHRRCKLSRHPANAGLWRWSELIAAGTASKREKRDVRCGTKRSQNRDHKGTLGNRIIDAVHI
jgi:hypothetical protein